VSADPTVADVIAHHRVDEAGRLDWQDTPAGRAYRAYGVPDRAPFGADDADVELVAAYHKRYWGRALTDDEKRAVAIGATKRTGFGVEITDDSYSIARSLGWGVSTVHDYRQGKGLAVRVDGRWQGDPDVAARAERAEAARDAARSRPGAPGPLRGVG
jgi:hypothetical protein